MKTFEIKAHWDDDSRVWRAECAEMPKLTADASTVELLLEKLRDCVPDVLVEDGEPVAIGALVPFRLVADRVVWASRHLA
jgi:predicted RNase H-like HicB family nuclease